MHSSEHESDISIEIGLVPAALKAPRSFGLRYQANQEEYLLTVRGVGRYLVTDNGSRIVVEPSPSATERDVRSCLFDYALNAALRQRGTLALHASAIKTPVGAVIFTGPSGAGKSTLLACIAGRGYPMLGDDIAAIAFDADGKPGVLPAPPYMKMNPDALSHLRIDSDGLETVRSGPKKFLAPAHLEHSESPVPLAAVFALEVSNGSEMSIDRQTGHAKAETIRRNTRSLRAWEDLGQSRQLLERVSRIAKAVEVFRVVRSNDLRSLDTLADRILNELPGAV